MPDSKKRKKNRLTKINTTEVSGVFAEDMVPAVPKAVIAVTKAHQDEAAVKLNLYFQIQKYDEFKGKAYGRVLVPDEVDLQDDVVTKEDIEEAIDKYMENLSSGLTKGNGLGIDHKEFEDVGFPTGIWYDETGSIQKSEFGYDDSEVVPGAWVFAAKFTNDEYREKVKKGELKGWSIGASGVRIPLEKAQPGNVHLAFATLKSALGMTKAESETYDEIEENEERRKKIYHATWVLSDSLISIVEDEDLSTDQQKAKARESISQFSRDIAPVFEESVDSLDSDINLSALKTIKKQIEQIISTAEEQSNGGEAMSLTQEQVDKSIDEKLDKFGKDLDEKLKPLTDFVAAQKAEEEKGDGETPEDPVQKSLNDITEKLTSLDDRISKFEKTPGDRNGKDPDEDPDNLEKKEEKPREKMSKAERATSSLKGTPLSFQGK